MAITPENNNNEAGAAHGLAGALRQLAQQNWAVFARGAEANLAVASQAHAQLHAAQGLLANRSAPDHLRYTLYLNLVETDQIVAPLRKITDQLRRLMGRAMDEPRAALDAAEKSRRLASVTAPLVNELIQRRNYCARELGQSSFAELILASLGVGFTELEQWLAQVIDALGPVVLSATQATGWLCYQAEIDSRLAQSEALVALDQSRIEQLAGLVGVAPEQLTAGLQADSPTCGMCQAFDRPAEVQLLARPTAAGLAAHLLLHELGHYLHYTAPAPADWQLGAPPTVFDETLASLLELAGYQPAIARQLEPFLLRPAAPEERLLQAARQWRWAVSALFELRAYRAAPEAFDGLWAELMQRVGFTPTFPLEWSLDSFYIDDPVYRFNYPLGACWAAAELARLQPQSLQQVAARIQELGEAGYQANWREVLGIADKLPTATAYLEWVKW